MSQGSEMSGTTVSRRPRYTTPLVPSMEIHSPSAMVRPATVMVRAAMSMSKSATPTTAGLPNWRATRAAWLVRPPRLVRMPSAASMPWTSSGLVSGRTMMVGFPSTLAQRSARSASKAAMPTAAPGDTLRPLASRTAAARDSAANCGWRKKSTWSGLTRITASSRVMRPSSARSAAMRTAAWAVRFPLRVCRIHSLPRSTVNSMSCMSR